MTPPRLDGPNLPTRPLQMCNPSSWYAMFPISQFANRLAYNFYPLDSLFNMWGLVSTISTSAPLLWTSRVIDWEQKDSFVAIFDVIILFCVVPLATVTYEMANVAMTAERWLAFVCAKIECWTRSMAGQGGLVYRPNPLGASRLFTNLIYIVLPVKHITYSRLFQRHGTSANRGGGGMDLSLVASRLCQSRWVFHPDSSQYSQYNWIGHCIHS